MENRLIFYRLQINAVIRNSLVKDFVVVFYGFKNMVRRIYG